MTKCSICNNYEGNKTYVAREMMFGFRDAFEYMECLNCGCVQLLNIPEDLSKYYPSNYYSLEVPNDNLIKKVLKRTRANYSLGKRHNLLGKLLVNKYGVPPYINWLRPIQINLDDAILDFGSGTGRLLLDLKDIGFTNLTGMDPYIEKNIEYGNSLRIIKCGLAEVKEYYQLIMLHHTFEHMEKPLHVLSRLATQLQPNGSILIRIPIADSYAWKTYKENWVQLDPPRHLYLHTRKSLKMLAEEAGLKIFHAYCDSTAFQFYGSIQYQRDIPLRDNISYYENPSGSIFPQKEINSFQNRARELNAKGDGDQACFYLRKICF